MQFRIFFTTLIFVFIASAGAQTNSGFLEPSFSLSRLNGQTGIITGARAMWIINGSWGIGGEFYSVVNNVSINELGSYSSKPYSLELNYGGLCLMYVLPSIGAIRGSLSFSGSGGGMKLLPPDQNDASFYGNDILLWEPRISFAYTIIPEISIVINGGYRFITQMLDYHSLTVSDIQSWSVGFGLRFGKY
jgi:hypothetical protein